MPSTPQSQARRWLRAVAARYRREVAAGIRAALALASECDDLPWDAAAITPVGRSLTRRRLPAAITPVV